MIENILLLTLVWGAKNYSSLPTATIVVGAGLAAFIVSFLLAMLLGKYITKPLKSIWQTIVHLSPTEQSIGPPPSPDSLKLGRELITNLTAQIYQLASIAEHIDKSSQKQDATHSSNFIASNLPLPLVVLNKKQEIIFANEAFTQYLGLKTADVMNTNVYSVLDMSFTSDDTFDNWLKDSQKNSATAIKTWERVKISLADQQNAKLFDLAAYYNKDNPQDIETMLVLFDHTSQYSQDEQAMSFVALTVHELRTPLTLLRGYIEVFEEELAGKLDPQLNDFMFKMSASAQQLTAFVNNILNVARIDDDQLTLSLHKQDWRSIVQNAADSMALRAKVRGITIEYSLAPDIPEVGVDRVSIYEVLTNLIDNAIKYSGNGKKIKVNSYVNQEGYVETTVQDYGVGIPSSIMPNLFSKFYRNHRNRAQIGGTGLGLYLSKSIIAAHGGNIWVRSKEGEGTTFSFTVMPYKMLADSQKNNDNKDIVRSAHGWIKNHSLYRR